MLRLPTGFTLAAVERASSSVPAAQLQQEPYASRIASAMDLLARATRAINRTPADIRVTSVLRSPSRNEAIGGSSYSHHLSGYAVDFNVTGVDPTVVWEALKPLRDTLRFDELAVYDTHVHLSADPRARGKILDFRRESERAQGTRKTPPTGAATLGALLALLAVGAIVLRWLKT